MDYWIDAFDTVRFDTVRFLLGLSIELRLVSRESLVERHFEVTEEDTHMLHVTEF